jgi:hypothetical protein
MRLPIQENALKSYDDVLESLFQLLNPLLNHFDNHNTQLNYGHTGSRTSSRTAAMEGCLRPLWGLVPARFGGCKTDIWERYREAITYGTNPIAAEYWGDLNPFDQRMVEMAPIGFALAMVPEEIYDPLSSEVKDNLVRWLNQINALDLPDNNWRFFVVLVNIGLKNVGAPYDPLRLEKELDRIESFYLGDGWYSDGPTEQRDYYVSFAIHFYGLVYSKIVGQDDAARSERFRKRSEVFAKSFIYWFGEKGDALPYGRSLTYRFAQISFWCAMVFAEVKTFSLGHMKGLILRHLRQWFSENIFDNEGILSIGYKYENLLMAEGYNATGSPYWAMKSFLILALDSNHEFWQTQELPMPELKDKVYQEHSHMVICRESAGHFAAFTSGQYAEFEPAHMEAKYEKFVYSNLFGFSVAKGLYGLEQGAFDNMLALSEGDHYYRGRHNSRILEINEGLILSQWKPWSDVIIKTWLIPGLPWHIRIHIIDSKRPLWLAEGGYAIQREDDGRAMGKIHKDMKKGVAITFDKEKSPASGIYDLLEESRGEVIQPEANTNICKPLTLIPTLMKEVGPGKHLLISAVYGSISKEKISDIPILKKTQKDGYEITGWNEKTITIDVINEKVSI